MPASGRKNPKWSGKSLYAQADRWIVRSQVLGFQCMPVCRQNEFGFGPCGRGAFPKRREGLRNLTFRAYLDMDIVSLKNPANVGLVRRARAQPLDRRLLVAKSLKEGIREVRSIERLFRELRYSFFNFNGVQRVKPSSDLLFCFGWPSVEAKLFRMSRILTTPRPVEAQTMLILRSCCIIMESITA